MDISEFTFMTQTIYPLSWFGLGSVKELLELPMTMLNRMVSYINEDSVRDSFRKITRGK